MFGVYLVRTSCAVLTFSWAFGNAVIDRNSAAYTTQNYQNFLGYPFLCLNLTAFRFDSLIPLCVLLLHGEQGSMVVVSMPPRLPNISFQKPKLSSLALYSWIPVGNLTSCKTSDKESWASPFFLKGKNLKYPKQVVNIWPHLFPREYFSLSNSMSVHMIFPNRLYPN